MLAKINTVAFHGLEVLKVNLQLQISSGLPAFNIVGLPDKAVAESKERVRASLESINLPLPAKRITVNLAPADLLKEGSHFDLPIALALLSAMGIIPQEELSSYIVLGELSLDGSILPVSGILPVAIKANSLECGLICPEQQGGEALWSGLKDIIAADSLISIINHFKGTQNIPFPKAISKFEQSSMLDMKDVKGQESAKLALEVAAAGNHNVLMVGPPGSGKSMLASRLPSILPPLNSTEALETSIIHSVAGKLKEGRVLLERPFRDPHHNASTPALVGGGRKAQPGEISLAHNGVLFLDELPEFSRQTLEALRQPLENGYVSISRVNAQTTYPANFQLVAAMNPCRCGHLGNAAMACSRAPKCAEEYQSKISGPLLDRIDIHIEVPAVNPWDLADVKTGESSEQILKRVIQARQIQEQRFLAFGEKKLKTNSQLKGELIEKIAIMEPNAQELLITFANNNHLSARAYHRTIRLARTIADLQNNEKINKMHIAQALSYRKSQPKRT